MGYDVFLVSEGRKLWVSHAARKDLLDDSCINENNVGSLDSFATYSEYWGAFKSVDPELAFWANVIRAKSYEIEFVRDG